MTDKPKATAQSTAITAARGGLAIDDAAAARIAAAISPALATFDCPSLRMPMSEEPSGWTQRARAGKRK